MFGRAPGRIASFGVDDAGEIYVVALDQGALLRVDAAGAELGEAAGRLHELSPLAVLARGYSVALRGDGRALGDASAVEAGERLTLRLHRGALRVMVEGRVETERTS